jgi:hypothetical protein
MQLSTDKLQFVITPNQTIPKDEGPKVIPLILDFSSIDTWDLDGQMLGALTQFSMVQTLFIDMNGQANPLTVTINGSGQKIIVKTNTQGYYNVLCPNPFKIRFEQSAGGGIAVPVYLINTAIPGAVWDTV